MKKVAVIILLGISSMAFASEDIIINGTIPQTLYSKATTKRIKLLHVQLSDHAKDALKQKSTAFVSYGPLSSPTKTKYPEKKLLGMGNVPVLDQGLYGTCVTFATTGAIDAVLQKGDYISQLCNLQLSNYLTQTSYHISGWNGATGNEVLSQIDAFGYVNKKQEAEQGCGGLQSYPIKGNEPTTSISLEEFHSMSEPFIHYAPDSDYPLLTTGWTSILDFHEAFIDRIDTNKTLSAVKASLVAGDRLILAALLADVELGIGGAIGNHKFVNDSWVLTPEIARGVYINPPMAGHAMIITGYDDQAIAKDPDGKEHRGLLTLRNSWGSKMGDQGDFYMSYDYFKLLVIQVIRVRSANNTRLE